MYIARLIIVEKRFCQAEKTIRDKLAAYTISNSRKEKYYKEKNRMVWTFFLDIDSSFIQEILSIFAESWYVQFYEEAATICSAISTARIKIPYLTWVSISVLDTYDLAFPSEKINNESESL